MTSEEIRAAALQCTDEDALARIADEMLDSFELLEQRVVAVRDALEATCAWDETSFEHGQGALRAAYAETIEEARKGLEEALLG